MHKQGGNSDKYDVAFSLLSEDEPLARAIQGFLPPEFTSFLYSTEQRELIRERDGLNAFPGVFREARICVILYRDRWGATPWSRLEASTIGDRFMDEGSGFLVLVRLDAARIPSWFPRADIGITYSAEGAEKTAEYIVDRLKDPDREFKARVTARTLDRRPVSLARYQSQKMRATNQYVPGRPEICDACTTLVEFRPISLVTLPGYEGLPPCQEKLSPPCARERGIGITSIPVGMDEDVLYAKKDPSFAYHIRCLLKQPVLAALSYDSDLKALGVTNVGATTSGDHAELVVCGDWKRGIDAIEPLFPACGSDVPEQTKSPAGASYTCSLKTSKTRQSSGLHCGPARGAGQVRRHPY